MHIVAVVGSLRPDSYTLRLLELCLEQLQHYADVSIDFIQPRELDLALPQTPGAAVLQQELVARVNAASGVILATPEYHGSYSSVMKVLIDNMGYPSALAGKPVALIGAASGVIGAVKALEHLRSVCSHVGAMVLPYPVSVALVEQQFDAEGRLLSPQIEGQLRNLAVQLHDYILGRPSQVEDIASVVRE